MDIFLSKISLFGICYTILKGGLYHYGTTDSVFNDLSACVNVLNAYTLQKIEVLAPLCQ